MSDAACAGGITRAGASRRLLPAVLDGEVRLLLSTPLLEHEAMLDEFTALGAEDERA